MHFAGNFPKENITYDNSVSDALKVVVLAVVPGTELPLRDDEGKVVATFKATEDLIHGAISSFRGGIFNLNHEAIPDTMIGVYDSVIYDNGFKVSGSILCPVWKEKIMSGDYSGISIEGDIIGEMTNPDSIKINAISFLSIEENPQGGACPLVDSEGNQVCKVEIIQDELESNSIQAAWDGTSAEKQIWSYATDKEGNVVPAKAKKCFLKIDGDTSRKESYSYPFVTISNGSPTPNREALISALKYASGARGATKDPSIIRKIKTIMMKNEMDLPPSLQSKLEASFDKSTQTFSAKIVDENNEVLSEKNIIIINDSTKGDEMKKKEEIVVEAAAVVETPAAVVVPEVVEVPPSPEVVVEAAGLIDASVVVPTPAAVEVPLAPVIEAPVVEPKKLDWELVAQEIGIKSKDEFTLIKQNADKIPDLEKKIDLILKENEGLREYKDTQTKKFLLENYPPAVVRDIAASFAEYTKDPAAFTQKYDEDRVKFAASKSVKLAGSAAESELTDEARRALEVKNAVSYLKRRNGIRV